MPRYILFDHIGVAHTVKACVTYHNACMIKHFPVVTFVIWSRLTCLSTRDFWVDWRRIFRLAQQHPTTATQLPKSCSMCLLECHWRLITLDLTERSDDNFIISLHEYMNIAFLGYQVCGS